MNIGFTGTQKGMTAIQKHMVAFAIASYKTKGIEVTAVHHGDCIGADTQFHNISKKFSIPVYVHPPLNESKRAFNEAVYIYPKKDYLKRNKDIVDASNVLIATPGEHKEMLRSGTWSTVRYARSQKKKVWIIYPDGTY